MPKQILTEHRFDFRGGRNTAVSPDRLNETELIDATNARLDTAFGAFAKRTGTRRLHQTAIGSGNPVRGVFQWNNAGTLQVVAICNGNIYHKTSDFGQFTQVVPSTTFSTTIPARFATFRQNTSGAPLRLYIADGTTFQRWTGSVIIDLAGTNSVPNAEMLAAYHTRMFTNDPEFPKFLFWSAVGNAETHATGGATDGGSAMIDTLSGDEIVAMTTIGGSLMVATDDSIARFSGYSSDDIQIAQDTEGISAEVGIVGVQAYARVEQLVAFMADRGPYMALEAGTQSIGFKVEPDFEGMTRTALSSVIVEHHKARREVWYAYRGSGDSGNQSVLVFNYRLQQWYGPFTYSFQITSMGVYEDSNGDENVMAGCSDGFVRLMDTGAADDVLYDNSGGSAYTMTVILAPFFFDDGPGYRNTLRRIFIQGDFPSGSAVTVAVSEDGAAYTGRTITESGSGIQSYRVDLNESGHRFRIRFTDANSTVIPIINGISLEAYSTRRPDNV